MTSWVRKLAEAPCPECKTVCPACHRTGALVPELWAKPRYTFSGQAKQLIPEAEQRQVMEDWWLAQPGIPVIYYSYGRVEVFKANGDLWVSKDENRTEALAHAICKAKGVE